MKITVERGTEGPRHDPYSFEEVTIKRADGRCATAHVGLAEFVVIGQKDDAIRVDASGSKLDQWLISTVGVTLAGARRAFDKLEASRLRMHRSHGGMGWSEGFPGEMLLWCKCGAMLDSSFNRSAIE